MGAKAKRRRRSHSESDVARVLHQLINNCKNPERFIELYYWSQEPELAEFMRNFVAMPDAAKSTLQAFLHLAEGNLQSVEVVVSPRGDITLSCSTVTTLLTVAQKSVKEKSTQPLH